MVTLPVEPNRNTSPTQTADGGTSRVGLPSPASLHLAHTDRPLQQQGSQLALTAVQLRQVLHALFWSRLAALADEVLQELDPITNLRCVHAAGMLPEFYGPMTAESLQIDLEVAATLSSRQLGHRAGRTEGLILSHLTDRIAVAIGVAPAARRHECVDFFLEGGIAADDGTDILHSHAMSVDVDMQATAALGLRYAASPAPLPPPVRG